MNETSLPLADDPLAGMSVVSPGTRQTAERILALLDHPMSRQQVAVAAGMPLWLASFEVTAHWKEGLVRRCGRTFYIRRGLDPTDVPPAHRRPSRQRAATANLFERPTGGDKLPLSVAPDGRLARILAALGHPRTVNEVAEKACLSQHLVRQGMRVLRERGDVVYCGRRYYLRADAVPSATGPVARHYREVMGVLAALAAGARTVEDVVRDRGIAVAALRTAISELLQRRLARRVGFARYAPAAPAHEASPPASFVRPSPIADRICDLLCEPRRPMELRGPLQRPIPTITGHPQAMMRKARVKRLSSGLYVRAEWSTEPTIGGIP